MSMELGGCSSWMRGLVFVFQAEDGIRGWSVTGVQTCALPIWLLVAERIEDGAAEPAQGDEEPEDPVEPFAELELPRHAEGAQIGRASCRERAKNSECAA